MASNTDHTGNAKVFSSFGKDIAITKLAKTNMTQAELDAAIRFIETTSTVAAIADDTTGGFNTGVSDAVHVLTEGGVAPAAASNFGVGTTGITTTVVAYFSV